MAETANKQCAEDHNDSSSASADVFINEESADSDVNDKCVKSGHVPSVGDNDCSSTQVSDESNGNVNNFVAETQLKDKTKCNGNSESKPVFTIRFRNRETARRYNRAIRQFLKDLIKKNDPEAEECDISDLELDIWEDEDKIDAEENSSNDHSTDDLFTIDTTPTVKDDLDIPSYDRKFAVLEAQNEVELEQRSQLSTCFNCLGDHSLKDCPKPRDPSVINKNRKEFMNKHGNYKASRYHLDDDQRFARFTPGEISSHLSKALGLSCNQLPRFIYRMRLLGYPPGWMEDAKVSHSGLSLFDSHGQEVADPDEEEGEIFTEGSKDKYDITKIISFPGFNVPPVPGTRDDSSYHRCPPIQDMHSKQKMLTSLQSKETRSYKRKRISVTSSKVEEVELPRPSPTDMEVDDVPETVNLLPDDDCRFIPPLPKDTPPRPPPPPSTESDSEGADTRSQDPCSPQSTVHIDSKNQSSEESNLEHIHNILCSSGDVIEYRRNLSPLVIGEMGVRKRGGKEEKESVLGHSSLSSPRAQSPSLSDLEAKKRQLLAELEDGGSSSDNTSCQKNTPTTPNVGRVKSVSLGTPVLKSASPYLRLPSSEKFSKDICDVINFENLPDSTGKYEQMSGLIKKVRSAVARIHNENDE